ncbi:cytochrome P450 9e2-like [Photinus pyralis]|nr:cytochrome P450 9e2-like [Photinus pyralis]
MLTMWGVFTSLRMLVVVFLLMLFTVKLLIYYIIKNTKNYWEQYSTPHEKTTFFFGNLARVILGRLSMAEYLQIVYNKHKSHRYVGIYQFQKPTLILRDLKLINEITVREFDKFPQHVLYTSEKADPIWAHNLFAMPGNQEWKDLRATLSPAFTSNKLKTLFYLIDKCAQSFTEHLLEKNSLVEVEMKEAFAKLTNDIIASTALGATCNSLKDPHNAIYKMGVNTADIAKFPKNLKFFMNNINTKLTELMKVRFISEEVRVFFQKIIQDSIKMRESTSTFRPDIIQLLMEARKGQLKVDTGADTSLEIAAVSEASETFEEKSAKIEITDDIMTAQAVIFFLAGFDTSSTAMSFAAYELALHPHIQQKLLNEIRNTMGKEGEKLTYQIVTSMKYLDMVVSEVLRKWPPFAVTDRTTVQNYVIQPAAEGELPVPINSDVLCLIPIFAIHRDPEHFPNPEEFNPDRFLGITKRPPGFLPFGSGRRNCIGSRFALLEIKIALIHLLLKFEIVPIEKTPIPIVLSKTNVNPISDRGFWLGLKPRHN